MSERVLAERYAQALINICPDLSALKDNLEKLDGWAEFVKEHEKVAELIYHPQLPFTKKRAVLEKFGDFTQYPELVRKYILYLIQKERGNLLPLIIEHCNKHVADEEGILRGTLRFGRKLPSSAQDKIISGLEEKLGKKLQVKIEEDPSLLGGIVLHTENKILDASIKNYFKRFLQELQKGV